MTPEARGRLAAMLADWLRGGELVVYDDTARAAVELAVAVDGATVIATGVFDERTANFHWQGRDVVASDGVVVDSLAEDHGVKMLGAVWTLEVPLAVVE